MSNKLENIQNEIIKNEKANINGILI